MSEKYLRVTMPDGSKWDVPAKVIALNRSEHYGDDDEYDWTMKSDASLKDWAANNMNWSDVEHHAQKVQDGEIDYQEGWVNGAKEVVEKLVRKREP